MNGSDKRRARQAFVSMAALTLAACGSGEAAKRSDVAVEEAVPVTVAAAAPISADGGLQVTGTVRAKRETALSFNSSGRVAAILVDEGQSVARGQLLARLDATEFNAEAAAARAEYVRASTDLKRLRDLLAKGWVTKPRFETAEAAAAAAKARLDAAGFDARYSRIYAPVAGVVLRRHVENNQMVASGTPVVTIGETAGGYVLRVPLTDSDLARVTLGQRATVTIPALGGRALNATIVEIGSRSDERTGTFEAELALPPVAGLRSGLIGDAQIRAAAADGDAVVAVPSSAVFDARADEGFVYVLDRAKPVVRLRMVQLGSLDDREVVVSDGLRPGELVVSSGVDRLRDGAKVALGARRPS